MNKTLSWCILQIEYSHFKTLTMKYLSTLVLFLLSIQYSCSQHIIYEDNFDTWVNGVFLGVTSPEWQTWSGGMADDVQISAAQSFTQPFSVEMLTNKDVVFNCGGVDKGKYEISFNFFIKDGYGAYFNAEHEFKNVYAFDLWFNDAKEVWFKNGVDSLKIGQYDHEFWHSLSMVFDLTNDSICINLDQNKLGCFVFSNSLAGENPSNVLDVLDFYGMASFMPEYGINASYWYFDDFKFTELVPTSVSVINQSNFNLYPNPTNGVVELELKNITGTNTVLVRNMLGQKVQEYRITNSGHFEFNINGPNGFYFIEVSDENGSKEIIKVIKNHI